VLNPEALQDRLLDFGVAACSKSRRLPRDFAGVHVAKQLIRCGTSPAANYAEARSAESRRDFIHKLQVCLKELRETAVWLRYARRLCGEASQALEAECDELIAIVVASIRTARKRGLDDRP
jgi:four helix bundle protein